MPKKKAKIIGLQDPTIHQKTSSELLKQQKGISGRLRSIIHNKQSTAALDEETRLLIKRARLEALEADNYNESLSQSNILLSGGTGTTTTLFNSIEEEDFYIGEPETSKKVNAIRPRLTNLGVQTVGTGSTASSGGLTTSSTNRKGGRGAATTTSTIPSLTTTSSNTTALSSTSSIPSSSIPPIQKPNVKIRKLQDLLSYELSPLIIETKGNNGLNTIILSNGQTLNTLPLYTGSTILAEHNQAASINSSTLPIRPYCMVCGYEGKYTCIKCGTRYCSIKCGNHHQETRCIHKPK